VDLTELVAFAIKNQAADIHLAPGLPPQMTFSGALRRVNVPPLSAEEISRLLAPHVSPSLLDDLRAGRNGEFRFEIPLLATVTGQVGAGTVVLCLPGREAMVQASADAAAGERRTAPNVPRSAGVSGYVISLALLGIVLVGAGLARLAFGIDAIPEPWRFAGYELAFLAAGILLVVPAVVARIRSGG
jgi:hypothetical protein